MEDQFRPRICHQYTLTFIDDPCPGSQLDRRYMHTLIHDAYRRLSYTRNIGLRAWLQATMYLKAYCEIAEAYVLQLHTLYNVIT